MSSCQISGTVYWITGLPGAGKTTVTRLFVQKLKQKGRKVILLDGDELRIVLNVETSYSFDDRKKLGLTYSRICKMLADQGIDVVIATVSLFSECHKWNRSFLSSYVEIYLSVRMEEIKRRNQKGLFTNTNSQVVGVDIPFNLPLSPDIILDNSGDLTPEEVASELYKRVVK